MNLAPVHLGQVSRESIGTSFWLVLLASKGLSLDLTGNYHGLTPNLSGCHVLTRDFGRKVVSLPCDAKTACHSTY